MGFPLRTIQCRPQQKEKNKPSDTPKEDQKTNADSNQQLQGY